MFALLHVRQRMDNAEERALIERARQEPEAFGQLYEQYVARIYNYHYRHTGNVHEAEDLTSRTFYRALRSLSNYQERGYSFQAWLFRIAHNLVVNLYRDQSRRPSVPLDDVLPAELIADDGHERLERLEEVHALAQAFEALPEERKTLILLKFVERLSNEEIAIVLGRTEGAVKALYHRTLITLRRSMAGGETDEVDEESNFAGSAFS